MGGMRHDEPNAIAVKVAATRELTDTFPGSGPLIIGCDLAGHHEAGMRSTIELR